METDLYTVEEKYFSRVWQITREINENIRHYNDHQTRYRSMASQWLLGAFAAIGFVLVSNIGIPFDKLWLIFAIAFIGALGVYQLWKMDMLVFNVIISVFFNAGRDMEKTCSFIPPIRNATYEQIRHHNTGQTLFYFYYVIIFVFSLICIGVLLYLIPVLTRMPYLIISALVSLLFLRGLFSHMRKRSSDVIPKSADGRQPALTN